MFKHINGGTIFHKQFLVCGVIWDRHRSSRITPELIYRGSYMSAHVLLNLLNKLGKRDKM